MKSQDIGLLLKLVAIERQDDTAKSSPIGLRLPDDWRDWAFDSDGELDETEALEAAGGAGASAAPYTTRSLERVTGISKSQINLAYRRCHDVGLVREDRLSGVPRVNKQALFNLIVHGVPYIFPAKPGSVTRGIGTSFAAPVLSGQLMSAGELSMVWQDARGNTKGRAITPLFKTVPYAVRRDPDLYALLALSDALRVGQPRERQVAGNLLENYLMGTHEFV